MIWLDRERKQQQQKFQIGLDLAWNVQQAKISAVNSKFATRQKKGNMHAIFQFRISQKL